MGELRNNFRPCLLKFIIKAGVLCLLVGFILTVLIVAISSCKKSGYHSGTSPANACINNLRQIDGATQQWALDNQKRADDRVTWNDIAPYLKNPMLCPQKGKYTVGPVVSNAPTCLIPDHKLPP
jgi:hypothetical protein